MRKISTIFLLILLMFNIVGYHGWFYYAEKKADAKMETSLDKNEYNESDLISLSVPLNMPYQFENSSFERVNGEISFGGKIYKYVKRKISDGNLILLCLPDLLKMNLKSAKTEYGNFANDIGASSTSRDSSHPNLKYHACSEYEAFINSFGIPDLIPANTFIAEPGASGLPDSLLAFPGKPPRSIA